MHIAAMKPNYSSINQVPKEIKEKLLEEGKEKAVKKMYA